MTTRILFCGSGWHGLVPLIEDRLGAGASIRIRDLDRPLEGQAGDATVIIPSNASITVEVLDAARNLQLIQQTAAGYEGVDVDAARARGIPVCNAPGKNAAAVAETALFLILALAKRLGAARRALATGVVGEPVGIELDGKTLGIVGLGASGSRLARAAGGLGMQVISVNSKSDASARARLFSESDVISLHCPLTPNTRGLVDEEAFACMKPGALLVNCTRGPVIVRAALERALAEGDLGGVGLDVHWVEPPDLDDPLYLREDVVALPHVAGSTRESYARLVDVLFENLRRLDTGEALLHRVV